MVDLCFATILKDLGIPDLGQHDACNDAIMAAMMYLHLRDLQLRGIYLARRADRAVPMPPMGA